MPVFRLKGGMFWGAFFCLLMAGTAALHAQNNPSAREDAQIERQKILRAADQIELIVDQHNGLVAEQEKLKAQLKSLGEENAALAKQLAELRSQAGKEREALLEQISKLLAEQEKRLAEKIQAVAAAGEEARAQVRRENVQKQESTPKSGGEEGYNHVVKNGQTLWSIAKAFNDQGVKVSVGEIQKANNLKEGQALKAGQKLFIPAK